MNGMLCLQFAKLVVWAWLFFAVLLLVSLSQLKRSSRANANKFS